MGAIARHVHTLCVEKKLLLSLLSMERSLGSKEGGGDWHMMPELLNKRFQ